MATKAREEAYYFCITHTRVIFRGSYECYLVMTSGPGGPGSPLFLEKTEARRDEKNFLGGCPPPTLSEGLDPPLDFSLA